MSKSLKMSRSLELYEKYKKMIYRIAYSMLKNEEDAMDVLQEVAIALIQCKNTDEISNMPKWISTVTKNKINDLLSKQYGAPKNTTPEAEGKKLNAPSSVFDKRSGQYINPIDKAAATDLNDTTFLIEFLDATEVDLIEKFYFMKMRSEDIARLLQMSESLVRKRLKQIRTKFKKNYFEEASQNGEIGRLY